MGNILDQIVADKRVEVEAFAALNPLEEIKAGLKDAPVLRDFYQAMTDPCAHMRVIAEVKRASPSAGLIREDFDPIQIASTYATHGARAISCLTDVKYFQGELSYLRKIREAVPQTPLIRKDFIIDAYQVYEARVAGADAVLLIAECLSDELMVPLIDLSLELGMTVLFEVHADGSLERALKVLCRYQDAPILLGINNRDLTVMKTDLNHVISQVDRVPDINALVSESGVKTHADIQRLQTAGINSVLVGEGLMRQADIGAALENLIHG